MSVTSSMQQLKIFHAKDSRMDYLRNALFNNLNPIGVNGERAEKCLPTVVSGG